MPYIHVFFSSSHTQNTRHYAVHSLFPSLPASCRGSHHISRISKEKEKTCPVRASLMLFTRSFKEILSWLTCHRRPLPFSLDSSLAVCVVKKKVGAGRVESRGALKESIISQSMEVKSEVPHGRGLKPWGWSCWERCRELIPKTDRQLRYKRLEMLIRHRECDGSTAIIPSDSSSSGNGAE